MIFSPKNILLLIGFILMPVFGYFWWAYASAPETLSTAMKSYAETGAEVKQDFAMLSSLAVTEEDNSYRITDTEKNGIDIQFANAQEQQESDASLGGLTSKLTLDFPKDYSQPIDVKLDDKRTISITDLGGRNDYKTSTLSLGDELRGSLTSRPEETLNQSLWNKIISLGGSISKLSDQPVEEQKYIRYENKDRRKEILYSFQKDQATGEKKLKHWTLYQRGDGVEQEQYQFANAKIKVNESGIAEVYYFGEQDIKNEQVSTQVDSNLMARAKRTLAQEMGEDILNGGHTPDFIIPKPYFIDNTGNKHDGEWKWNESTKMLSVSLTLSLDQYPIALDPTLSFVAPGQSSTGSVITGEASSSFSLALTAGDFNADGRTDLAVGAYKYSSETGRTYIFYNDGSLQTTAGTADVTITGETTSNRFGFTLTSGDFNADGRTDLVVGAYRYSTETGRAYIFYNDGSIPTTAATADVTITGETTSNRFGITLTAGDFNADGRIDLAVGAYRYSSSTGRAYIFYNDGSIPTTAGTADVTITGETTSNSFGIAFTVGDFNTDGRTDLVVGASDYSTSTGRAYIFYNDGSIPTTAGTADVTITGETTSNNFGYALTSGDFNADGTTDLVVNAYGYSSSAGRVYIFYSDGSIPTTAGTADVTITGETTLDFFGAALSSGDFNADGRVDLVVGAQGYSANAGRTYIFYNDGSIPTTAGTADVTITGEAGGSSLSGATVIVGDFNADGRTDLVVGASGYSSATGRAYIFYSQNGQINTNQNIVGEATSNSLGYALTSGDFNADGRTDLAVGAYGYSSSTGRAYIFYNDGFLPTTAATADVTITGETTNNLFGYALTSGDFNADGRTDLAVGAYFYSTSTGRAYIFYNDGSIPTTAATADVTITGETTSNSFGYVLSSGDFNADGTTDLAVGASGYSTDTGRAYIFYNDGSIPTTAATADVTITGETTSDSFGSAFSAGDFNADGRTDLAVGAFGYSSFAGRTYIFYNDGSIPTTAGTADVTITGETTSDLFGSALTSGDFNADGTTDLAVGASGYSTSTGRAYIFHNDGSIPTTAATADVTITGETTSNSFGVAFASGDFNADGTTDLAVGASDYSSSTGRAYIFHNDGSIPTTAVTADITITGETTGDSFGIAFASGDFNVDGTTDLAVGAFSNSSSTGKVYMYETRGNFAWEIQQQSGSPLRTGVNTSGQELRITGETTSNNFGHTLSSGDFNADGKTDLVVSATAYSSNTGRVYIFYSNGSLPTGSNSADIVITGEDVDNFFGYALTSGDWNADGTTDLAVGAYGYSTDTGRAYLFYNDGSIPTTAATADVTITGGASGSFGYALTSGDFNADGTTDLVVSNFDSIGHAYIFYNDGSIPTTAGTADVTITGEASSYFGTALSSGDFNADGTTDLAVGAYGYSSFTGRAYIFYNDGSIPTTAATADVTITGETTNNYFGYRMTAGDFNADGTTDLAVGAFGYSTGTGRAYILYNDGSIPTTAGTADVTITGETTSNNFGYALTAGDFNADGRTDLAAGASDYSSSTGRAYIFYNDGSIPTTAATADVTLTGETTSSLFGIALSAGDFNNDGKTDLAVGASGYSASTGRVYIYTFNDSVITGETTSNLFGYALTAGDFNADGRTDLAVGAYGYSTSTGRAYIFYNDGSISTTAGTADVTITGETTNNYFGYNLTAGDFNADGKIDLAVSAERYSSFTGRAYIFYNDGSIPTTAATADVTITGEASSQFGVALTSGDFNADGRTDLVVGADAYSISTGRAYIFYNDGSIPTTAATADVTITGGGFSNHFGFTFTSGDFNADGTTDLAVGGYFYSTSTGRVYIFYNDGSIPTTAGTADVTITGETTNNDFGYALTAGDWNADGRTDLAVGAFGYSTSTGRVYIFYNDGSIPTTAGTADVTITGETTNNYFGISLTAGDWNADGRVDLVVGAQGYSSNTGRAYIFYNDGSIPTTAGTADVTITGETTSNNFGSALTVGDWNADGRTDLAVSAYGYSTSTGRVYIFTTEASAETTPNTTTTRGTVKFRGTVKLR